MAAYFGALFLIYGIHLPYFPVWLDWRGLSAQDIAIITALPFFVRFLASPAIAFMADKTQSHRTSSIVLSWIAFGAAIALTQSTSFAAIAIAALVLSLSKTSVMPLTETLAMVGVTRHRLDYGKMRLWGSLTFIAASFGGGVLIEAWGASVSIWLLVAACALTAITAYGLPTVQIGQQRADGDIEHADTQSAIAPPARSASLRDAWALLKKPAFIALLAATGAVQATHATYYTFGTLHWLGQGIGPIEAGLLWGIGVIAEIIVFAKAGPIIAVLGAQGLLVLGCCGAVLRWAVMSLDPAFWLLLPLQALHGLTFGATHVAAIYLVGRMVPQSLQGTGQALVASVGMGLAMGAAMLLSGWLYQNFAGQAYLGMTALAVAAVIAGVFLQRNWDGKVVVPG
ncbi:MAG: MFS transporter [Pseudomonadota bacterium]